MSTCVNILTLVILLYFVVVKALHPCLGCPKGVEPSHQHVQLFGLFGICCHDYSTGLAARMPISFGSCWVTLKPPDAPAVMLKSWTLCHVTISPISRRQIWSLKVDKHSIPYWNQIPSWFSSLRRCHPTVNMPGIPRSLGSRNLGRSSPSPMQHLRRSVTWLELWVRRVSQDWIGV